ncbi:Gfo/Idh/MocA family protein [Candidatus Hydrogenedentota bacterium]
MSTQQERRVRVALAGLRFGAAFIPIYLDHPNVKHLGIVDPDVATLMIQGDRYGIDRKHTGLAEVIKSDEYDAVHLVTPIPLHTEQTIAVLNSGKHCACAVPMATSLEDLDAIVTAQRESGKNYMMMETAVYSREFLYAQELVTSGRLGRIQFLRGAHYQDMAGWAGYWEGLPPMLYGTHAISPGLAIAESRAVEVHCFGSGVMDEALHRQYGNPFPVESAIFQLEAPNLAMEVTRSHFQTARGYAESFCVYGEKMTFEWPQVQTDSSSVVFTKGKPGFPLTNRGILPTVTERISPPDRKDMLPLEIARFTVESMYDETDLEKDFKVGGGHHGSHPHLVHEFIRSIVEERKPWIDEVKSADWTAAGICAHDSAMQGGKAVRVPSFL